MFKTVNALVLRETRYKDADRILTILTDTDGKLTVKARGALRKSSKTAAATQQLTYSEMTLFGNRGRWTVNEASVKEAFSGLRENMEAFALGAFFAECMELFSVEEQQESELLQLGLNSLYALSRGMYSQEKIKAAFELRLMCLSGYMPETSCCAACGKEEPTEPVLSLGHGRVFCRKCIQTTGDVVLLETDTLDAMRKICTSAPKRFLQFSVTESETLKLGEAAERYLLQRAERTFPTLDYWKSIRQTERITGRIKHELF